MVVGDGGHPVELPSIAVDAAGGMTVVWSGGATAWANWHPSGGSWGETPTRISGEGGQGELFRPLVAAGSHGEAIVAWRRSGPPRTEVRLRDATGTWGPVQDVTIAPGTAAVPSMDDQGNAFLAWAVYPSGEIMGRAYDASGPDVGDIRASGPLVAGQAGAFTVDAADRWSSLGPVSSGFRRRDDGLGERCLAHLRGGRNVSGHGHRDGCARLYDDPGGRGRRLHAADAPSIGTAATAAGTRPPGHDRAGHAEPDGEDPLQTALRHARRRAVEGVPRHRDAHAQGGYGDARSSQGTSRRQVPVRDDVHHPAVAAQGAPARHGGRALLGEPVSRRHNEPLHRQSQHLGATPPCVQGLAAARGERLDSGEWSGSAARS